METAYTLFKTPNMMMFDNRLMTYHLWSPKHPIDKHSLSHAGFYYTNEGDSVKCFSCGIIVSQWCMTDNALNEHRKWSPNCIFLKIIGDTML